MDFYVNVTQKGQITIPKAIRDALGIVKNKKIKLSLVNKKKNIIRIEPTINLLELAGFLKDKARANQGKSVMEAREYVENHYYDGIV
jgi:AbrB family looped-hinge helix DNA binding protein